MVQERQTIKFYGLLSFQCKDGYLAAPGLDGERLFLRTATTTGTTTDEAPPFFGFSDACVFRVVPTLSSLAAASNVKGASGGGSGGGRTFAGAASSSSTVDNAWNSYDTADFMDAEEITYGKSFSLVHKASGLYLSVAHALPSENDPDCLSVVLVKPAAAQSPSCELTMVSRYKIHADGDKLRRTDSVLLRLASSPMFLHVSAPAIMEPKGDNAEDRKLLQRTFRPFDGLMATTDAAAADRGNTDVSRAGGLSFATESTGGGDAAGGGVDSSLRCTLSSSFSRTHENVNNVNNSSLGGCRADERCSMEVAAEALTREFLDEVNACEESGVSFTVLRYDIGTDRANHQRAQLRILRPYVACGVPLMLYHRERESVLMASATQRVSGGAEVGEDEDEEGESSGEEGTSCSGTATPRSKSEGGGSAQRGDALSSSLRRGGLSSFPIADLDELAPEDGPCVAARRPRRHRGSLAGVTASRGAEAAIRNATTALTAGSSTPQSSPGLGASLQQATCTFNEGDGERDKHREVESAAAACSGLAGWPAVASEKQRQRRRQRLERRFKAQGLMDTGDGRWLPYPLFAAPNQECGGEDYSSLVGAAAASGDAGLAAAHHNATALWYFEHDEPTVGGPLRFGGTWQYRLRHVASGMYLAVCGSAVDAMLGDGDDEERESVSDGVVREEERGPSDTDTATTTSAERSTSSAASTSSVIAGEIGPNATSDGCKLPASLETASGTPSLADAPAPAAILNYTMRRTSLGLGESANAPPIRETGLCLIPPPQSRKDRAASLFCVEAMFAGDATFLIEQTCLAVKNVLTEMFVVTDASVEGGAVQLSLDWQPSRADPIVVSYVPYQLQADTRFIASQAVWLARYRAEMQSLVRARQEERLALLAAAMKGDEEATRQLDEEKAYRAGLPEVIRPHYNGTNTDKILLKKHRGRFSGTGTTGSKDWVSFFYPSSSVAAAATGSGVNNWSIVGPTNAIKFRSESFAFGSGSNAGGGSFGAAAGLLERPSYASMHHTIRLCQRALIALIEFCSESDETHVLRREGLPIKSRQKLFCDMHFYRLVFDVLVAPLQLLECVDDGDTNAAAVYGATVNSIAALMKPGFGSFDEVYENLRIAQQQHAELSCLWSGVWSRKTAFQGKRSSNADGVPTPASARRRAGTAAVVSGIIDAKELLLPLHQELHLLTRLGLRLLREMIRESAVSFTSGWSAHIPDFLQLDGLRLHVVETMQEFFTNNPRIPLRATQQVTEHFITLSRRLRRGAYMDFLGAACIVKYKGIPERQAFVCQKLLVENPQSLCRIIVVVPPGTTEAEGSVYIMPNLDPDLASSDTDRDDTNDEPNSSPFAQSLKQQQQTDDVAREEEKQTDMDRGIFAAPPPGFVRFVDFYSASTDKKQVVFISNQIALFARLCYDGCPEMCRSIVSRLFPRAALKGLLRSFVWTGEQVVGHRCPHDVLRSFLIRLTMQCFVLPRIAAPAVQLRVSTVLFGSSRLRHRHATTYSGLRDDEMTELLKSVILAILRHNSFFVQEDTGRSLLIRGSVSVWLKLTRYRQYTREEILTVLPMLIELLDGTQDVLEGTLGSSMSSPPRFPGNNPMNRCGSPAGFGSSKKQAQSLASTSSGTGFAGTFASAAAPVSGASRLVHKVESVHLMRIREMICEALYLALQHEVFRAADTVIVYLYKAYVHSDRDIDTSRGHEGRDAGGGREGSRDPFSPWTTMQHVASALATATHRTPVSPNERRGKGFCSEISPLLSGYDSVEKGRGGGSKTFVSFAEHRQQHTDEEESQRQSFAAAQLRASDGYQEIGTSPHDPVSVVVSDGTGREADHGAGDTFSARIPSSVASCMNWATQMQRAVAVSTFATLSSSDDEDNELDEQSFSERVDDGSSGGKVRKRGNVFTRVVDAAARRGTQSPVKVGASAAEAQALLDYHTSCIVEHFQPDRLVPFLFDVARYDCRPLTVQAMTLLVHLSVVKRSVAQLVLKVNTLPSLEVLRNFDKMYVVAVQLRESYQTAMNGVVGIAGCGLACTPSSVAALSPATQWEPAIQAALEALLGPQSSETPEEDKAAPLPQEQREAHQKSPRPQQRSSSSSRYTHSSAAVAEKRAENFRKMYESFRGGSTGDLMDSSSEDDTDDSDDNASEDADNRRVSTQRSQPPVRTGSCTSSSRNNRGIPATHAPPVNGDSAENVAAMSMSMRRDRKRQRIASLWSKTSGAVRMLVYNNTIRNRRRALGLSETSTVPVNVIIRAEMMAHWKIHETLLQMLAQLTPADAVFTTLLQFFYTFSFSESNSLLLQPYVTLFVEKLYPEDKSATVCLHIIIRVLRSQVHVEDFLTPQLLEAMTVHINDELYTKLPDPELVDMLSQYVFSKTSVSPVVRRRMMILFREHGTLMNLSRFRLNPTPVEVVFTSALVNLVCSICGSHTSVLTLARSMLPADNICSVILQRRIVDTLPSALLDVSRTARRASQASDYSATPSAVAALKLLNPYVRLFVALYLVPKNDTPDACRRRCLQWMGNAQLWEVVKLFTVAMDTISGAIEQDAQSTRRVLNRGLTGIQVFRTLMCSTIPVALAALLINVFSNEGYSRYHSEVIGRKFFELSAAAARFGALLMQHAAALSLTVEEVVNYCRFLGVLCDRLNGLRSPLAGAALSASAAMGVSSGVNADFGSLAERCDETMQRMRVWLAAQQHTLEAALAGDVSGVAHSCDTTAESGKADTGNSSGPSSFLSVLGRPVGGSGGAGGGPCGTATASAFINSLRRRQASSDEDMSAFRLLFAEEAVSQAQLHSQEMLEAAGLGAATAAATTEGGNTLTSDNDSASAVNVGARATHNTDGMSTNGLESIGLLLPGILASSRGVSAVRASLRATLKGDTVIPSVRRGPSEVSMIAIQRLLRCAHDEAIRESVTCILEALTDNLLRPRTFVGVLNLFANTLDTALHYPELVKALCGTRLTGWSENETATLLEGSPTRRAPPASFPPRGPSSPLVSESGAGRGGNGWNPDTIVSPGSLGYALQTTFNDTGMLTAVVSLCGVEADVISLNATRLGVLILEGGNRHAQNRLLQYFLTREEGFFHNVRDILQRNVSWVENINAEHQYYLMKRGLRGEAAKSAVAAANIQIINALTPQHSGSGLGSAIDSNLEIFTASKSYVASLNDDHKKRLATLSNAVQVSGWARVRGSRRLKLIQFLFRLLQLFCEGHFAGLQNYIRAQHDNLHSANVILESMAFIEEISIFVTPSNYRVLLQGFELLTEVCQGPCRANQEALIDYGACRVIHHTVEYLRVQSSPTRRELTALLDDVNYRLQRQSPAPPATIQEPSRVAGDGLEYDVINRLGDDEAGKLRVAISNTLLALLEGCREADAYRRVLRQIPLTTVAVEVQYAVSPATLHLLLHDEEEFEANAQVEAMFNWLIYLKSVEPYAALEGVLEGVEALLHISQAVSQYLGSIEIKRADGLERVYFRIPLICRSLTRERKDALLWSVDRTSRATKLADFLHKTDEIIFAVEWNHAFHSRMARWTRWKIHYYNVEAGERPGLVRRAARAVAAFYNDYIAANLFPYEIASYDMASMTLAVLSNTVLVALEGGQTRSRSTAKKVGDRTVLVLCILQTAVCGFTCAIYVAVFFPIHLYGVYKNKQRHTAGKVRLNVELTEVYADLTAGERWRSFWSWFDIQFRITLLLVALLSCTVSHYFAAFNLMLVVYSIPTLRTFISAITMNGKQLLLTSFMGIIMLYLFSIVGFLVFPTEYNVDADPSDPKEAALRTNCDSLLQCFAYILDQGLRAGGGVGDVMQPWTWGSHRMLTRLAYDMLFYALVTVVFLNILFGIIIDTFGQMRDEKREKETDMHGFCFVCGLDADTLEKSSVMGFANHVQQEHNMWMYLYFMHHLRRKDSSEYTGQESFVNACIKRSSLNFFPEDNCISLMEMKASEAQEQADLMTEEEEDEENLTGKNAGLNNKGNSAVDTAAAAASGAVKELAVARDALNAQLREWQGDSARMKTLLQQLELMARSAAAGVAWSGAAGGNAGGGVNSGIGGAGSQSHTTIGGGAASSVRSGQTLPPSERAETLVPSESNMMERPVSALHAAAARPAPMNLHSSSLGGRGSVVSSVPSSTDGAAALRAMQAHLQTERELRQRYEQERKTMKDLLQAKEAELRKLKKGQAEPKLSEKKK